MKHQETHCNGIARKTLEECWKSHLEILKGWLEKQTAKSRVGRWRVEWEGWSTDNFEGLLKARCFWIIWFHILGHSSRVPLEWVPFTTLLWVHRNGQISFSRSGSTSGKGYHLTLLHAAGAYHLLISFFQKDIRVWMIKTMSVKITRSAKTYLKCVCYHGCIIWPSSFSQKVSSKINDKYWVRLS